MTEISMTKTHTEDSEFLVLNFEHSNFDIVSDFGFRYSDFELAHKI